MNKNVILISLILVFAITVTGCSRGNNGEESPEPVEGEEQTSTNASAGEGSEVIPVENLVFIENGRFSPKALTVKKGTTVTWKNKSEVEHWVISDPHPTHSDLPGLDSKKGLLQNETYEYTFDQTGEWYYHDKLNTIITGKVIVEN